MSVRLFIGNLPYSATDADLRTMFGEVAEREAAEKVIEKFNGAPLQGRPIAVSEARAREDRPSGPRPGGGFGGPRPGGYGGPPSGGFSGPRPGGGGPPRPFAPREPMSGLPTQKASTTAAIAPSSEGSR